MTHDQCTSIQVYRIDEGHFGDTRLDGLKFALFIRSGKVMSDGNWIFAGIVDEKANDAQRKALAAIVSGEAGGPPAMIRETLVSDFRGVAFEPIEFTMEGLRRSAIDPGTRCPFDRRRAVEESRRGARIFIDNTEHPRTSGWRWRSRPSCTSTASGSTTTWRRGQQRPLRIVQLGSLSGLGYALRSGELPNDRHLQQLRRHRLQNRCSGASG